MHYRYLMNSKKALSIPYEFQKGTIDIKKKKFQKSTIDTWWISKRHCRYPMNSKMHYRYSKNSFWTLTVPKLVRNNLELDFKRFPPWKSSRTNWIVYAHSWPFCLALIDRSHGLFAVRLESSFMQQPLNISGNDDWFRIEFQWWRSAEE